jgi:hypothetical protein
MSDVCSLPPVGMMAPMNKSAPHARPTVVRKVYSLLEKAAFLSRATKRSIVQHEENTAVEDISRGLQSQGAESKSQFSGAPNVADATPDSMHKQSSSVNGLHLVDKKTRSPSMKWMS